MTKKNYFSLPTFALASVALSVSSIALQSPNTYAASFGPISQIYAYGDSYSEDGTAFEISTQAVNAGVPGSFILPADPALGLYDSQGRWTNGLTAVEVLSESLQVGHNRKLCSGGCVKVATAITTSWLDSFQDTGVFGQIEQFSYRNCWTNLPDARSFALYVSLQQTTYSSMPTLVCRETIEELAAQTVDNISRRCI